MTVRDREVLDLLRNEPELLAIADAVSETQRPPRRLRPGRAAAGIALAAAALFALLLASPWERGDGTGLIIDRALAAVESPGAVVHFTFRFEQRGSKSTLPPVTIESFYDKQRGVLRVISRSDGKVLGDYTTTAPEDEFNVFPGLFDGAAYYRQALAAGNAKVVGQAFWEGRPVYWLELEQEGVPGIVRIGVDRESYRPVVFRFLDPQGRWHGSQVAILGLAYVTAAEAGFDQRGPVVASGTVVDQDCRPIDGARVGLYISPDLSQADQAVGAEVASARTGPDGRFALVADPSKSPFREALAAARKNNAGWLNFDINAQGKRFAGGTGYWAFSRFVKDGKWWDNEVDQPEKPAPIKIRVAKDGAPGC